MPNRRLILLFLLSATVAYSGTTRPSPKPQESFAPYWTSEPGWATQLQLKNNLSSRPLTVTPVLRLASGQEISLDATTIPPNSSVSVWVNEGLLAHSPDYLSQPGSFGSVVFRYTSLSAMNLHATVVLMIQGEPVAAPIPAHSGGRPMPPGSLEGIWWQPHAGLNDVLVIGNHSDKKISGTLSLYDAAGKQWSEPLVLDPRQTQRMATSDLVQRSGLTGNYGGISISLPSSASAVDAVHFMYDEVSKFSASLELFTHDPGATLHQRADNDAKYWTMWAPMLALRNPDPALNLPHGTVLQPNIFVRNTTAKGIVAELGLTWRGDSGTGQVKLPELQLPPFATSQLQIGTMRQLLRIPDNAHWASVALTTTASPDDLIALATSVDASGRYNLATRFTGGIGGHFVGGEWPVDANHNEIAAITNIGAKPTNALLTLHYDNGEKHYEMQQAIQPGDQMWVNIAELVRNRVPDRNGNTLPVDLGSVTYDLRDLTPGGHGLMVNALAADASHPSGPVPLYANCCGYDAIGFDPSALDVVFGTSDPLSVDGTDECDGVDQNISADFGDWGSDNSGIAQVARGKVTGMDAGSTSGFANGNVLIGAGGYCAYDPEEETLPITVFDVGVGGRNYILVGSDSHVTAANQFQFTNQAQNGPPQPPNGTCCAASSDPSDIVTQIEGPPNNLYDFQFQTTDQSTTVGDRTLTFEYDLSDGEATSVQVNVTAREFAYVTNPSPSNSCQASGGKYGYSYTYVYTPYTHPDGQPISAGIAEGAPVTETVTPQVGGTACTGAAVTGSGSLNGSGEFQDLIQLCSNAPIPACDKKYTQVIQIAGYPRTTLGVRTNTLEFTNTQVIYTSQGPTQ
jgi:hypothetical protein